MSRRGRHGRPPHPHPAARPARPTAAIERPAAPADSRPVENRPVENRPEPRVVAPAAVEQRAEARQPVVEGPAASTMTAASSAPGEAGFAPPVMLPGSPGDANGDANRTMCTTAQLRRFIKSRPWVPMHELRRRFAIWGGDDDVTPIRVADHTLFIGLPVAEGRMVAELLVAGDVGYELSLDPITPVIVGVYPMRPVPRG